MEIKLKSYAKINYFLDIKGIREDGYHIIETIMSSIDLADTIRVKQSKEKKINVFCHGIETNKNTAYKAALLFQNKFDTCGADIYINKGIPLCGGLGGSSADAAGVLYALGMIFGIETKELYNICALCGSDTSFMLNGGFAKAEGIGEIILPFECSNRFNIVIAKPLDGISAKDSYRRYDELNNIQKINVKTNSDDVIKALKAGNLALLGLSCYNALYNASVSILPQIKELMTIMKSFQPAALFMSGSGSACVSVFEDFDKALECEKKLTEKKYFAKALLTRNSGVEIL